MIKQFFVAAFLCLLMISAPVSPVYAKAKAGEASVREAQRQLSELGYYTGRNDGLFGPQTRRAVKAFQRDSGLPVSGELTAQTKSLLSHKGFSLREGGYFRKRNAFFYWPDRNHIAASQGIPNRYMNVALREEGTGLLSRFTITLNGAPIFFANNQPGPLQVSETFSLPGEDAIVVTSYSGDAVCPHKSFLLTFRSNNTYAGPKEIGSCSGFVEAGVAGNYLIIGFRHGPDHYAARSLWRYANGSLAQL